MEHVSSRGTLSNVEFLVEHVMDKVSSLAQADKFFAAMFDIFPPNRSSHSRRMICGRPFTVEEVENARNEIHCGMKQCTMVIVFFGTQSQRAAASSIKNEPSA